MKWSLMTYVVVVSAWAGGIHPTCAWGASPCDANPRLRRADCNGDGQIDLGDPVCVLSWLFASGPAPACDSGPLRDDCPGSKGFYSADCNGDGRVDLGDGVCLLTWLFSSGNPPPCIVQAVCGDGTVQGGEVCDDSNTAGGDGCNPTCNLRNTTSLLAGMPGSVGLVDGIGTDARLGGYGGLLAIGDDLWFSDGANNVIRRIDIASGEVETVAGDAVGGAAGYRDAASGSSALFQGPEALTTDGETLWIADSGNHRIRAMSLDPPHAVRTVAGSGANAHVDGRGTAAGFQDLRGLTYVEGIIYLLDGTANTLRSFDPASGDVETLAGAAGQSAYVDGPGAIARFVSPRYMTATGDGILYISDTNGAAIRTYDIAEDEVSTFAGNGVQGYVDGVGAAVRVHRPRGITFDGKSVYWTEFNQHTIRQGVLATGSVTTLAGRHCSGQPNCTGAYAESVGTRARFSQPFAITYHAASGVLFVLDGANYVIRKIE